MFLYHKFHLLLREFK